MNMKSRKEVEGRREKGCLAHIFSMYILQGDGFHICEWRLYLMRGFTRSSSRDLILQLSLFLVLVH